MRPLMRTAVIFLFTGMLTGPGGTLRAETGAGSCPNCYNSANPNVVQQLNDEYQRQLISFDDYQKQLSELTHPVVLDGTPPPAGSQSDVIAAPDGAAGSGKSSPDATTALTSGSGGFNFPVPGTTQTIQVVDNGYGLTSDEQASIIQVLSALPAAHFAGIRQIVLTGISFNGSPTGDVSAAGDTVTLNLYNGPSQHTAASRFELLWELGQGVGHHLWLSQEYAGQAPGLYLAEQAEGSVAESVFGFGYGNYILNSMTMLKEGTSFQDGSGLFSQSALAQSLFMAGLFTNSRHTVLTYQVAQDGSFSHLAQVSHLATQETSQGATSVLTVGQYAFNLVPGIPDGSTVTGYNYTSDPLVPPRGVAGGRGKMPANPAPPPTTYTALSLKDPIPQWILDLYPKS